MPADSPLNLPNPIFGIFFYMTQLFVTLFSGRSLILIYVLIANAVISNIGSVYLAYVMFFVLNDICVVCIGVYVANFFILLAGLRRLSQASHLTQRVKMD